MVNNLHIMRLVDNNMSGSKQYFIEFNVSKCILCIGYGRHDAFHMRCVKR